MTDRIITCTSLAVSFAAALAILAMSACAPVPHVECNANRNACTSSIVEVSP